MITKFDVGDIVLIPMRVQIIHITKKDIRYVLTALPDDTSKSSNSLDFKNFPESMIYAKNEGFRKENDHESSSL